jgi:hypothetical protein
MTRRAIGPKGYPTEITQSEDGAHLRVPLGSSDELVGWLSLEYLRSDPLSIAVTVRAPSRATVLERQILRRDLQTAQSSYIDYANLRVGPAPARGFIAFQFEEAHVIVTAIVPVDALNRFLRTSHDVVAPGQEETEAISAALMELLEDRRA